MIAEQYPLALYSTRIGLYFSRGAWVYASSKSRREMGLQICRTKGITSFQPDFRGAIVRSARSAKTRKSPVNGLIFKKASFQYSIDPDDVYDFDETGFTTKLTVTAKVQDVRSRTILKYFYS